MVDHPGPRKVHVQPMPLLGGLAIYLGVLIALLVSMNGPALMQVIGIYAARLSLPSSASSTIAAFSSSNKIVRSHARAAVILLVSGIRAQVFSNIWPGRPGIWADTALTWSGSSASPLLQHFGSHGWAMRGVAAMASLFFAIFALENGQLLVSTMAAAVLGAAAGFLRWNFKPAKIFMGDGGAMFLGFLDGDPGPSCAPRCPAVTMPRGSFPLHPRRTNLTHADPFPVRGAAFSSLHGLPGRTHRAPPRESLGSQRTRGPRHVSLGAVSGLLSLAISICPRMQPTSLRASVRSPCWAPVACRACTV